MRNRVVQKVVLEDREGKPGKACTRCDEWKPLDDYNSHKTCVGKRDSVCKECRKLYRKINSDSIKKYNHIYRNENRETIAKKDKEYRDNNKERYQRIYKEYRDKNKENILAKIHKKRAEEFGLYCEIDGEIISEMLAEFKRECPITGSQEIHLDHFIPISKGGETSDRNLIPLKRELNASKHNHNPFEWAKKKLKGIELVNFNNIVEYLAMKNNMSVEKYKQFVNEHFKESE